MKRIELPVFTREQIIIASIIGAFIIFSSFFACSFSTNASQEKNINTYYKTVIVDSGDTLWSIAAANSNSACINTNDYIKEIQKINHILEADDITVGQTIVIPYYTTAVLD